MKHVGSELMFEIAPAQKRNSFACQPIIRQTEYKKRDSIKKRSKSQQNTKKAVVEEELKKN